MFITILNINFKLNKILQIMNNMINNLNKTINIKLNKIDILINTLISI